MHFSVRGTLYMYNINPWISSDILENFKPIFREKLMKRIRKYTRFGKSLEYNKVQHVKKNSFAVSYNKWRKITICKQFLVLPFLVRFVAWNENSICKINHCNWTQIQRLYIVPTCTCTCRMTRQIGCISDGGRGYM